MCREKRMDPIKTMHMMRLHPWKIHYPITLSCIKIGSIDTRIVSIANGLAASYRVAPNESRVSNTLAWSLYGTQEKKFTLVSQSMKHTPSLSPWYLILSRHCSVAMAILPIELPRSIPTIGINLGGDQNGFSCKAKAEPNKAIDALLTTRITNILRN